MKKKPQEITLHGTRLVLCNPCCSTREKLISNNIRAPQRRHQNILHSVSVSCQQDPLLPEEGRCSSGSKAVKSDALAFSQPRSRTIIKTMGVSLSYKADSQFTLLSLVERILNLFIRLLETIYDYCKSHRKS